jgi:hypothetical protein
MQAEVEQWRAPFPICRLHKQAMPYSLALEVRGHLLLAFFGISAFAVLGAGAALYSIPRDRSGAQLDHAAPLVRGYRLLQLLTSANGTKCECRLVLVMAASRGEAADNGALR